MTQIDYSSLRMDGDKVMVRCIVCNDEFQMGPHIYNGRPVHPWGASICNTCEKWNYDGIARKDAIDRILNHTKFKNLPVPKFNDQGFTVIPPAGSKE